MDVVTEKKCSVCKKDVANLPRKKDKNGKYWCVECDAQVREAASKVPSSSKQRIAGPSATCPDCGKSFPKSTLKPVEGVELCERCAYVRHLEGKASGKANKAKAKAGADPDARKRMQRLIGAAVLIAIFAVIFNWERIVGR